MNGEPDDIRSDLTDWANEKDAESDVFRVPLAELVTAGCDRLKIAWLLTGLGDAQREQDISRGEVKRIAKDMKEAAGGLSRLSSSQIKQMLNDDIDLDTLQAQLSELGSRAQNIAPRVHGRRLMDRDLYRAALIHYVLETTGAYHDDAVAALISVAESPIDAKVVEAGAKPVDEHWADAHVHWRKRDSCQELLKGPSDSVRNLLGEMEDRLKP